MLVASTEAASLGRKKSFVYTDVQCVCACMGIGIRIDLVHYKHACTNIYRWQEVSTGGEEEQGHVRDRGEPGKDQISPPCAFAMGLRVPEEAEHFGGDTGSEGLPPSPPTKPPQVCRSSFHLISNHYRCGQP